MITLYSGGPQFGLPEVSPYVTKTEVQLRMAGLAYEKKRAIPATSPKGQLPYILDDGELIADSTFIRLHLEKKYGFDFDAGLSARERAEAWAIERMIENQLGWVSSYYRFLVAENFEKGPGRWFDHMESDQRETMREYLRSEVATNIKAVGVGRHAPEEILLLGKRSVAALAALLGGNRYLMGNRASGADAIAFSMIAAIRAPLFDTPLKRVVEQDRTLCSYCDRMMAEFYPDHPWPGTACTQELIDA
ncbi:glutathione S-transferase family protein [Mycoplana rhizolycopersici]|uniref:Glutathione S-transferase family protein n=1 Tax=Mycoplana rhizolycopersici TaxID=2746702 RepID=A0ABX2Q9Y7_9HYPH|nr:glutathione S-transferase family protein [Rhizobium rhizolycopersici]NVP54547.1 glutathione S-transferase family protein [Rhizobium rhizolycopersici]